VPEAKAKGEKRMAWRKRRIVVRGAAVADIATLRRQGDEDLAEARDAEAEGAIADIGVVFGRAPCRSDADADFGGQFGEKANVIDKRKRRLL
jgi:hypothetical protein